jgi:SAM-dependent methyltransferase
MDTANSHAHWESVYAAKGETQVSWFQESPQPSLQLIEAAGATLDSAIIDVGGGASRLVDTLVARGYADVTVLDLSEAALNAAQDRLGDKRKRVHWLAADATIWEPTRTYDIWHDRAAFHFLTDPNDRSAYFAGLRRGVGNNGHAIVGTFALDGPEKCSGLPVARYDAVRLSHALGEGFVLIDSRTHEHKTPWDSTQRFQFSTFRYTKS